MFHLLVSDKSGRIFNIPGLEAVGMKAGCFFKLGREDFIKMPSGSRLFMLPGRAPVGYDSSIGKFRALENYFAVAAFIAPAYTGTHSSAYKPIRLRESTHGVDSRSRKRLPLYCYTAAAYYKGGIYAAAVRVDRSSRHDPESINIRTVSRNSRKIKKLFPANRLIRHLIDCALIHGCPGAQNFFLSRQECPLPVSPLCNAGCAGCISLETQPRIKFTPSPEEISEIALFHMRHVRNPVLSFGQGCEGEPLLRSDVIEKAIRLIRDNSGAGTININTNGSLPQAIERLFDAGLGSIRVSMNSVREVYYNRYYKPAGYGFKDVLASIKTAKKKNRFVSINYLTMPGFTDSREEFIAMKRFIQDSGIDMIQWRNLNFDPLAYFKIIKCQVQPSDMIGVRELIDSLKKSFPNLRMGYYNPEVIRR